MRYIAAVLTSLFLPGYWHLLAGKTRRGILIPLTFVLLPLILLLPFSSTSAYTLARAYLAVAVIFLTLYVAVVFDAVRLLRGGTPPLKYTLFQKLFGGLIFSVLFAAATTFVFGWIRGHWMESYVSPSASSIPSLLPGDRFFVDKRIERIIANGLFRGEMIVFRSPHNPEVSYVKRIVALPGDEVAVKDHQLILNGKSQSLGPTPLEKEYFTGNVAFREKGDRGDWVILLQKESNNQYKDLAPRKIEPGQVFVLGDNRDNSFDSRGFGAVPISSLLGQPSEIWLSFDPESKAFRSERMFTKIE